MLTQDFTSQEQIDQTFHDHIESLKLSGIPYDHAGLMAAWVEATEQFKENSGPDYTSL